MAKPSHLKRGVPPVGLLYDDFRPVQAGLAKKGARLCAPSVAGQMGMRKSIREIAKIPFL